MDRNCKRAAALLLAVLMAVSLLPTAVFAADGDPVALITPQCTVTASSGQGSASLAVDNDTASPSQWASEDMKTGTSEDQTQTPQWLTVDLGADKTYPIAIDSIKLWYNMKVWPMVYRIETADSNGTDAQWTTLASVSRSPFDGAVKNGVGQDIADETGNTVPTTAANADLITKTSSPALAQDAAVQRYVRFYVEKVNTAAPGNNVCLREIQIYAAPAAQPDPDPIEGAWNLAQRRTATASSTANNAGPGLAVDGVTDRAEQWNSEDMKTSSTTENDPQTPQWLQVDLGATGSRIDRVKLWYNVKVWPMVYELQTTDTPNDNTSWETVVRVERSPASDSNTSGWVENAAGQNIADNAENTDTITTASAPALQTTTLKRYVRFYCEKVNTAAGGHNINLREIEIFGVNDNLHTPVDVQAELDKVTSITVTANDTRIALPAPSQGATLTVAGSTLENVVANDGSIGGKNIGPREVTLLVRAWDNESPADYRQKNLTVTVPDHKDSYPAAWFPTVVSPNPKPEVIPAIQEWYGYNGSFTLTDQSRIVVNDAASVGLQTAAANMKADLLEITGLDLPFVTGTSGGAKDIYIESLTADRYDLGKEGYLMRVSEEGVKIYAPTYTGCLFGTITAEQILWQAADHASIPMGIMRDYPAYAVRGVKLDIARTPYRYQQLKDYAKLMLWYKMSEYDLHVNDNDNANIAKGSATMDTHSGFHRLESATFPSLAKSSGTKHAGIPAELVNADYYNNDPDYGGNPTYTKEQWRALQQLTRDYGMYLLTELDLPAHSLVYNKYANENPDGIDWLTGGTMPAENFTSNAGYLELLDLTGANKDRALRLATELWEEYTSGSQPTIYGDIVHIGADEYWVHNTEVNNAFASFADTMRQTIQDNLGADTKIRMWGATSSSFSTATTVLNRTHGELAEDYQLDVWSIVYDNPAQRAKEGYGIVNCRDAFLYGNPGRTNRDVPNAEYLFNSWDPTMFGGNTNPLPGEPNLLGAKAVIWGDQSQEGMTERDIHQRVLRAIAIVSEKTWGGATQSEGEFSDYELRAARLAEGPGTQIAMDVPSQSSLVLAYDFTRSNMSGDQTTVYDLSGNGYNATIEGTFMASGSGELELGGSAVLKTPLKTLSYPYTVSLDVEVPSTDANGANASLFSGYDGRIRVNGLNGHLCADVNYFTRDLGYALTSEKTTLTIVGTQQATRLYVDGELVTFLSQKQDQDGVAPGSVQTLYSSVLLPLEKIGDGFRGSLSHLRVYNKALSAAEVAALAAGTDNGLVNVAQNAIAGGSSPQGANDNNVQRLCYAAKALDGEEEELWSYWRADGSGNTLTVDLGESHPVSRIEGKWRDAAPSFTLQTSADGETWAAFAQGTVVNARFVKLTTQGAGNLTELLVYEAVDKTALTAKLAQAEALLAPGAGFDLATTGIAYPPVALARAVKENPLATNREVAEATAALQAAIDALEEPPTPADNAKLSSLTLSAGTLTPSFSSDVVNYTASVANSVTELTVTAAAADETAAVTVKKGETVCANGVVALDVGANTVTVTVTKGEATETYTVVITRAASGGGNNRPTGGSSRPSETTKTETLEDGTKVTTVTKPDGTVTKTAEKPDGSKSETVTTKAGDVTITVTDAEGEELAKVELPATIPAPETRFDDVPEGHWADKAIHNAAALELVKGVGNNKFDMVAPMSRGQLATVLHRLSQGKTDYETTFQDVAQGKFYTEGVAWAAKVKVVTGYTADIFAPEDVITREQLAVMLARYAKLIGMDIKADAKALEQFADGENTGSWAVDGVAWCVEKGILRGKGGNVLDPTTNVTRAEVAVMLDRFIALLK